MIQRNLIQPKLNRGYLAFDKCTLLSSQGSDAPPHPPTKAGREGQLHNRISPRPGSQIRHAVRIKVKIIATPIRGNRSNLSHPTSLSNRQPQQGKPHSPGQRPAPKTKAKDEEGGWFATWRGARPSGLPLNRLGRTSNNLRPTPTTHKSTHPPGRVARRSVALQR